MLGRSYESVLAECLDAMQLGATVDDCLARYPKHAQRLRSTLNLAAKVARTPLAAARPEASAAAWRAVQKRANELRTGKARPRIVRPTAETFAWMKPVAITAAVVGLVVAAGGGALYAAQDAPPDSSLYAVKLTGEDIRLWFVLDDAREANILLDQSAQRMEEINDAVRDGKPVPTNALRDMDDRNRRAANILVGQPENTVLRDRVTTQAESQEQRLFALWQQVREGDRETYSEVVANLHNTQLGGGIAVADIRLRPEALSGGILTISGLAELGEDGVWRIGGFEVRIDERTLGGGKVQTGASASILVAKSSNGQLQALIADIQDIVLPPTTTFVSGAVEEITSEGITVSGQFIPFSAETVQLGSVKIGQQVQVSVRRTADGLAAGAINQFTGTTDASVQTLWFEGTVEANVSNSANAWSVGGFTFQMADAIFDASAGIAGAGARVHIEAVNTGGEFQARRVTVLSSQATADTVSVLGSFQGYDSDAEAWDISGIDIAPPDNTRPENDPSIGSLVLVEARLEGDGLLATRLDVIQEPDDPVLLRLESSIQAIEGSRWTLESGVVRVGSTAGVVGKPPEVGKRVIVWATQGRDGFDATFARILDQSPVVTPAPVPEPSVSP